MTARNSFIRLCYMNAVILLVSSLLLLADHAMGDARVAPQRECDLYLTEDDINISASALVEGELVTISACIHNQGDNEASATVEFYADDSNIGNANVNVPVDGFDIATTAWVAQMGRHTISVYVKNPAPEDVDMTNNQANTSVNVVKDTFAPTITNITVSPEAASSADRITIRATLSDIGTGMAHNSTFLSYRIAALEASDNTTQLLYDANDTYIATIGPFEGGAVLVYNISARDLKGNYISSQNYSLSIGYSRIVVSMAHQDVSGMGQCSWVNGTAYYDELGGTPLPKGDVFLDMIETSTTWNGTVDAQGRFGLRMIAPNEPGNYTVSVSIVAEKLMFYSEYILTVEDDVAPLITSVGHTPTGPTSRDLITIYALVTDSGYGVDEDAVYLNFIANAVAQSIGMRSSSKGNYSATIGPFPGATSIVYNISVKDMVENANRTGNAVIVVGYAFISVTELLAPTPAVVYRQLWVNGTATYDGLVAVVGGRVTVTFVETHKSWVTSIDAQGNYTVLATAPAAPGRYTVVVNVTVAASELVGHNATKLTVTECIDLYISQRDIVLSDVAPEVGEVVILNAYVHNVGEWAANLTVSFYDGDPSYGGILIGTDEVSIPPGALQVASVPWYTTQGVHDIWVIAGPVKVSKNVLVTAESAKGEDKFEQQMAAIASMLVVLAAILIVLVVFTGLIFVLNMVSLMPRRPRTGRGTTRRYVPLKPERKW